MIELEKQTSEINKTRELEERIYKEYQNYIALVNEQNSRLAVFAESKKGLLAQIKALEDDDNVYCGLAIQKAEEIIVLKENMEELKSEFDNTTKKIDTCGYVKWVLSREGVVGVIIKKTFTRLESLINQYLNKICSEKLHITISPKKELKSGALRDEIDIIITKNGRKMPYSALSGGQEQRVTIATLLAIYKLSKELGMNKFNFLLLDEVLDLSLAEKGRQDIMALLSGMEREIRNIFIISHNDNLASEFAMQIDVRLHRDGITRLEGVYQ
jgi:DNA repair exonuclease SbcCD ATPase subunit